MPATAIDSAIFRDIFGTEAMRQVWSDGNRIQKYLDFEAALARAQARLKIIPQDACDEILRHCKVDQFDIEKLKMETERIACHRRCGGGLAEAHRAVFGLDADQHRFRGRDRDARHGHGRLERQRDRNGVDAADDQRRMLEIRAGALRFGEHA